MTKKKTSKGCECIDELNKHLAPYNTYVPREMLVSLKTGKSRDVLMLPTEKIDSKKRGDVKKVIAAYCPCCGARIPTP